MSWRGGFFPLWQCGHPDEPAQPGQVLPPLRTNMRTTTATSATTTINSNMVETFITEQSTD
ncbi:MAG: hypothetical protein MR850_03675 [Bacteroidales bacterium]|nr:hypothetical protein [Bacteroidales bacterium]